MKITFRNCLIFRENKLSTINLENKLYIIDYTTSQNDYIFSCIV